MIIAYSQNYYIPFLREHEGWILIDDISACEDIHIENLFGGEGENELWELTQENGLLNA